jgi:hypothetical protein
MYSNFVLDKMYMKSMRNFFGTTSLDILDLVKEVHAKEYASLGASLGEILRTTQLNLRECRVL